MFCFFFSSRRRHTRFDCDWSSDVCSSDLTAGDRSYEIWSLAALPQDKLARLPYSLKILLENLLRFEDGVSVTRADIEALLEWDPQATPAHEIAFTPARVILQDFTGVPCVVDLAAMRDAIVRLGGNAERVNPLNPAELVIDHSVQVDEYGTPKALAANTAMEFARNRERYAFLRWGQTAFRNFSVVPPNTGIVRSEEHTSELQSQSNLVCRLLLEKKKNS